MRKLICSILICIFVQSFCLQATPFDENQSVVVSQQNDNSEVTSNITGTVSTHGYKLNVRTGPWGEIVGSLSDNEEIQIIGSDGDWYKISSGGKTCYIHKNYVSIPGCEASMVDPKEEKSGYVNTPGTCLNIRTGPWGKIVGTLSDNAKVNIVGESGDWYKVSIDGKIRYIYKKYVNSQETNETIAKTTSDTTSDTTSSTTSDTYKASVIGKASGDGTAAGALTWARDQIDGTQKGYNSNNGKTSSSSKAWSGWCLAFVSTAYGRTKSLLSASSAIKSYYKCKSAGKIHTDKNPPAGAVMFTSTTSGNPYGHIFIATGKMNGPNDPIIITSTGSVIKEMPMSKMWKGPTYLGWAMP